MTKALQAIAIPGEFEVIAPRSPRPNDPQAHSTRSSMGPGPSNGHSGVRSIGLLVAAVVGYVTTKASARSRQVIGQGKEKVIRIAPARSGLWPFAVDRRPQMITARHLYANPTIGQPRPELDL